MWKEMNIKVLVAGSGRKCGSFLEALGAVHGVRVACILDPSCAPESLALARDMNVPLVSCLGDFGGAATLDVLINATNDAAMTGYLERSKPAGALVLEGVGARLLRLFSVALRKLGRYEGRYRAARREVDAIFGEEATVVGKSSAILEMQDLIERVAPTPTSVLLLGETGTGKDLAARSIHAQSHLKARPFVSINCTALTPSLMESELFGYKKGAFTGAEADRKGLVEEADGGTLFLDEIGDMDVALQAKLLRFLQSGEVRRVGSTRTRHVTVRVIAATNRNLEESVQAERFRSDLFYRFNAFTITLPPLRERKEDIPYLAYHFVTKAEAKLNRKIRGIARESLALMAGYDWPGNVRELENVIERAAILCRDGEIRPDDLALRPSANGGNGSGPVRATPGAASVPAYGAHETSGDSGFHTRKERIMDNFEKRELMCYLRNAEGNVSEASRVSGIPRRTFYRKMKKFGL
ncbi:MAG: sigma-54 interaction domain-containing protein [Desulfovibrionaceae bacterium]